MIVASLAGVEEAFVFIQDELYNLILEDHVHSDVLRLRLRSEESRTKYDCHVLHSHSIVIPVLNDPVGGEKEAIIPVSWCHDNVFHSCFGR